ncbi:hypothetical protein VTK56DRAFT_3908 [Thermocarpiscus australiensis]
MFSGHYSSAASWQQRDRCGLSSVRSKEKPPPAAGREQRRIARRCLWRSRRRRAREGSVRWRAWVCAECRSPAREVFKMKSCYSLPALTGGDRSVVRCVVSCQGGGGRGRGKEWCIARDALLHDAKPSSVAFLTNRGGARCSL